MTTAAQLAATVRASVLGHGDGSDVEVTAATIRAQDAGPGTLFAALPGTRVHGASFASAALDAGASAVLTDAAGLELMGSAAERVPVLVHPDPRSILGAVSAVVAGDPSADLDVVGITGTSGKTTTSYLVEAALEGCGHVATSDMAGPVEIGERPRQSDDLVNTAGADLPADQCLVEQVEALGHGEFLA